MSSANLSKYGGLFCDPYDGLKKVIMWYKKGLTFWYINVSLDEKLKCSIFIIFIYLLFKYSVEHTIYLIPKNL